MTTSAERALVLWQFWFSQDGTPYVSDGDCDDQMCFFCQAWQGDPHTFLCVYAQAAQLVRLTEQPIDL